jgi:hypothetical protein
MAALLLNVRACVFPDLFPSRNIIGISQSSEVLHVLVVTAEHTEGMRGVGATNRQT